MQAESTRSRILIADDNEPNVELLEAYLANIDADVAIAVDGQDTLAKVGARLEAQPIPATSEASRQLMKPFEHINSEAARLSADAKASQANGGEMSPSQMVMLTVRCHEFMFHCQLTSNIANRTSDGLQQLFRQQS